MLLKLKQGTLAICLCFVFVLTFGGISAFAQSLDDENKELKVLAVGNSFSVDAMRYLYDIAKECGATRVVLGNLHIGSCGIQKHWRQAQNNNSSYTYYKNSGGFWMYYENKSLLYGLQDEEWDIIILQQESGLSGVESSYDEDLLNLIGFVNEHKLNEAAKIVWHMTWAYQHDCLRPEFATYYNNDQLAMYQAIAQAVQNNILPLESIDSVIPAATAIQNVRTSFIGDTLTRDGYHLTQPLGRFIAGLTWLKALTDWSIDDLYYVPDSEEIPEHYLTVIKEAVNAAINNPLEITQSSYTPTPIPTAEPTLEPTATPVPTPLPRLTRPKVTAINSSMSKIKGNYDINGAEIIIIKGEKVIGSAIVKRNKFNISIKKQKPGTQLVFQGLALNYQPSPLKLTTVKLQKPKIKKATAKMIKGRAYAKSKVSVYWRNRLIGSGKVGANGKYKIKFKHRLKRNRVIKVISKFKSFTSKKKQPLL